VSGAASEADPPNWQEVVFSLKEQLSDRATIERLREFTRFAEKEGSILSAQLKKERASKEGKCRRTNQFRASPKLLDLQRIERTLASKKEYSQAAVIQKQAAGLEATEREKHSSDLGVRLSTLDIVLVEKELEAARTLNKRMLEKLWAMALEHALPFNSLHQVCAEVQVPGHV
jgi:MoxR-like ATPase